MADNTINVKIKQRIDTESNWTSKDPVLLKGEQGLIEGTAQYKIGDGTNKWSALPLYQGLTSTDRSKLDGIATGANKTTVDSALSSTSTNPVQNKVVNSALSGKASTNHTHDLSTMINTLSTGTSTPGDGDYYISQYVGGGTTTTSYHRRPMSALFEYIKGKLSTVAASGSYNDLSNKPTIPSVGNGTVTIKQAGTSKGTFTMNQSGNTTIELTDNNTTYSTGTTSTSGLTKLYTATGTATDGTMTQAAIKSALDGKAASGHTHNYAGSSSAGGSANSANKLTTARTVSGGVDIPISFSYDGSASSNASIGYYSCTSTAGNTNNYPFHRIAYTGEITGTYTDKSMTLYLSQGYQGGGFGIVRVAVRTNNSSNVSTAEAKWLVRSGFSSDSIQVALYDVYGKTYADVFFKSNGTYSGCVIRAIASDARGSINRTFTLVSSNEVDGTTTSDKKTSKEVYASITEAANVLHNNQAYTNTIIASDNATTNYANSSGSANAVAWDKITGKPSSFSPSSHTHDDRYYTETEMNSKLNEKLNTSGGTLTGNVTRSSGGATDVGYIATNSDTGKSVALMVGSGKNNRGVYDKTGNKWIAYADENNNIYLNGNASTATSATTATKLSSSAGSATQPVYFSDGKPVATTYTLSKSVPSNAVFTDTNNKTAQTANDPTSYTNWRPLLVGSSNNATEGFSPTSVTDGALTFSTISVQPSSGTIKATNFKGSVNGHTVNSDVPSGAKFTDTNTWRPQPDWNATSGDAMIKNKPSLGTAASKTVRTLTTTGASGWKDATTDHGYVPDMSFIAYWNGAYSGSSSNLAYCNKGAFGTAATANKGDFATASHTHSNYLTGITSAMVTNALGYTPPKSDTNTWIALKGATTDAAGTAGYAPAPSAGAANRYLRSDGTWSVPPDNNTTYSNMTAATSDAAGKSGLVPAPAAGKQTSFLRGDGTWVVPTNTTYSNFVKSGSGAKAGLVPAPSTTAGTTKYLREDGTWVVPPDTKYSLPTASTSLGGVKTTSTVTATTGLTACPIISGVVYYKDTNTTYGVASASANGLMSSTAYSALNTELTQDDVNAIFA